MKPIIKTQALATCMLGSCLLGTVHTASAAGDGWSVVPYIGVSELGDQSPDITAEGIANGSADVSVDSGFTAGLSVRYDYGDSRWRSEIGWEYRSNDSSFSTSDGTKLPDGNYASNTFYLNGRYALTTDNTFTLWLGGGLSLLQEIDIDSENSDGERSFADSGDVGFQIMAGADYDLTDRLYLSSELRYTRFSDLALNEEGGDGRVTGLDYQPVTVGIGLGFRF